MAPNGVAARRMSMASSSAANAPVPATTNAATPFTPQQQQALMRMTGGPLSQQSYQQQQHHYQHQYALMLQMQAHAAAVQQRQAAMQLLPQGHPQSRSRSPPQAGHPPFSHMPAYSPAKYFSGGMMTPQMQLHSHPTGLPPGMPLGHSALAPITFFDGAGGAFPSQHHQQQQQYPGNSILYHHPGHIAAASSPPPPNSSALSARQLHFVGSSEPANACYRLVTQSQLAQLQTTPIPASIATPALPALDTFPQAQVQEDISHAPSWAEAQHDPSTPMKTHLDQEQPQDRGDSSNTTDSPVKVTTTSPNTSLAMDTSDARQLPALRHNNAAFAATGQDPNTSNPPVSHQQASSWMPDLRELSTTSPRIPASTIHASNGGSVTLSNSQDNVSTPAEMMDASNTAKSGRIDTLATLPSAPSPVSPDSSSVTPQPATSRPTAIVTNTGASNPSPQSGLPTSSPPSSATSVNTSKFFSSPPAASVDMPIRAQKKPTQKATTSAKAPTKSSRPTLTVDTAVLSSQTAAPIPAKPKNPVSIALPQPLQVFEMATVSQNAPYAVAMQPVQILPAMYTQASPPGYATLRTLQLNHALTTAFKRQETGAVDQCISEFFHKDSTFKFSMSEEGKDEPSNEYLIPMCAIPRFYESMRRCGAQSIQLVLNDPQEWLLGSDSGTVMTDDGTSGYMVECPNATLIVAYASGSTIFSRGTCRATYHYQQAEPLFDKHGRLLSSYPQMTLLLSQLEYDFVEHTEMVNRCAIKTKTTPSTLATEPVITGDNVVHSSPSTLRRQPDIDNADASRPAKRPKTESYNASQVETAIPQGARTTYETSAQPDASSNWQECLIPGPPVRDTGLSDEAMRVLEIGEAVDHLGELICFSLINNLSPLEALEHYATLSVKAGFVPDPRLNEGGEAR